jgi:Fe2+ or Zn2+ uptake regulation protein
MSNYKQMLENSKLKTTPQRLAILKEIDKKGHASIEEIYEDIKEMFESISLATIYKNINSMKEKNIITEICLHQKPKYEITKEPHAHFVCEICGEVEDVPFPQIVNEELNKTYPDTKKELYLYGICQKCKNKDGNK